MRVHSDGPGCPSFSLSRVSEVGMCSVCAAAWLCPVHQHILCLLLPRNMSDKSLICFLVMQAIAGIRLRLRAHLPSSVPKPLFPIEFYLDQDVPCVLGLQLSLEGTRTPSSCPGLKSIQLCHSPFPSIDIWLPRMQFSAQRLLLLPAYSNTGQEPPSSLAVFQNTHAHRLTCDRMSPLNQYRYEYFSGQNIKYHMMATRESKTCQRAWQHYCQIPSAELQYVGGSFSFGLDSPEAKAEVGSWSSRVGRSKLLCCATTAAQQGAES